MSYFRTGSGKPAWGNSWTRLENGYKKHGLVKISSVITEGYGKTFLPGKGRVSLGGGPKERYLIGKGGIGWTDIMTGPYNGK